MKKNQMLLTCTISLTVIIVLFTAIICIKNSRVSTVKFEASPATRLIAKDKNAHKGIIKDTGSARFAFSAHQKEGFSAVYQKNQSAALVVRVEFIPTDAQKEILTTGTALPFNLGVLYQDDFDQHGRLKETLSSKISVYADLSKLLSYDSSQGVIVDFSMAIPKSEHFDSFLPQGFFVSSTVRCRILSACSAPAMIGFDCTTNPVFYGFASNGGVVNFQNSSVDFSGASLVFPVQNAGDSYMPQIIVTLADQQELKDKTVRLTIGGEKLYVKNAANVSSLEIPSASLKSPFENAELSDNKECITSLLMKSSQLADSSIPAEEKEFKAIKIDPGLIVSYNQKNWRKKEYEFFEWDRYPGILFFDIADYGIQDNFFRRLAYYVEKRGYKGTLWPDEVLADKHGYNAHDYSADSLASFFNKAADENFPLCVEELTLKRILIANGVLIPDGKNVKAGKGALVSISKESNLGLRTKLLAHEAWHTLFFSDEEFRNFVAAVYYTFDEDSRQFLIDFFESQENLGYDIEDEYLMHNEFMAYIMQQRLADVPEYFVGRANLYSVRVFTPVLAQYVRQTNAKGFEDAAVILNDYTYDNYGIRGGVVGLVNR